MTYNKLSNVSFEYILSILTLLNLVAGQDALSVLDEEEEFVSLDVGNQSGNGSIKNGKEQKLSKKPTKKM